MPPKTRYAACGDLSIAYQVIGDGPHDLVIIPGFIWHIEQLWNDPGYHRLTRGLSDFARVATHWPRPESAGRVESRSDGRSCAGVQ